MKKLKIILQHNMIYYVFLFIVLINYAYCTIKPENETNNIKKEEKMLVTNIEQKEYGYKYSFKGKENIIGFLYNDKSKIEIGDIVKVKGQKKETTNNTVPYTFNYKKYLKNNYISSVIQIDQIKKVKNTKNILYKIKNNLFKKTKKLKKSYPYINSLILGNNSYLDEEIVKSYRINGISHLFAISGLHISIFIMIIGKLIDRLKLKDIIKTILLCLFIIFYMFITNFSMSVIRGGLFTILLMINKLFNLKIKAKNLLILTLSLILIYKPLYLNNIGLEYSFIVAFALIIFSNKIKGNKISKLLKTSLISFLVAIPITINNFNEVNILSIIYNIFYVPVMSIIIIPLSLISYLIPKLDGILYIFIALLEKSSIVLSKISIGKLSFPHMNIIMIIIYYLLVFNMISKKGKIYTKLYLILMIFNYNFNQIIPSNKITILDVNQGDSILISLNRKNFIIDTGGKIGNKTNNQITNNRIIPYLKANGIKKIDKLILTHGDYDHMGEAKYLIENFKVDKVIFNCGESNYLEKKLMNVLNKNNIKYQSCIDELNLGNVSFKFLQTREYDNENDNSNVIYFKIDNKKFLFMGDAGVDKEQDIIDKYNIKDIDVLKVGHHGSNTSSSKEFISKINPKYSIISVGKNNRYGHPKDKVLETLKNSKIYRTDLDGSIEIKLNKRGYKIRTCPP